MVDSRRRSRKLVGRASRSLVEFFWFFFPHAATSSGLLCSPVFALLLITLAWGVNGDSSRVFFFSGNFSSTVSKTAKGSFFQQGRQQRTTRQKYLCNNYHCFHCMMLLINGIIQPVFLKKDIVQQFAMLSWKQITCYWVVLHR